MNEIKKIWEYGSKEPIQRIGIIIFLIGLFSLLSWMFKENLNLSELFSYGGLPQKRDSIFFHLFIYFIPLGLILSFGFEILSRLKKWIFNEQSSNKKLDSKRLFFKDSLSAFSFAVKIHKPVFEKNQMNFGMIQKIIKKDNAIQGFLVQLANKERTTLVTGFNGNYENDLREKDLVYWGFIERIENDINLEAYGFILAVLKPEYDIDKKNWIIEQDLTK